MAKETQDLTADQANLPVELFEATTDCVFVLDADWRFTYLNARARRELGSASLVGTTIWQSFPGTVGSKFEEVCRRVAERRETETLEHYYRAPLNAWYEGHVVPFHENLVVFFRNITKRQSAAEALLRRHDELDTVLSRAGVGIMQYAHNHRLIVVNDRFCEILGRTKEELDGLPMEAFTHPDDVPANAELLTERRRSEAPFRITKRYVRPSGEIVWCSVAVSFVRHSSTNEPTQIVVATELTEEIEAQKRAEDTQKLLQAVVDSAEDLIFVKDLSGKFVLTNKKMTEDFGIAAGDFSGARFPDLAERFQADDRQVIATGERAIIEEQFSLPSGVRTLQTIKVPWQQDGTTQGVIAISRDISYHVQNEQALRESEERFRLATLATRDAIWEWDLSRGTVEWSSSSPGLTGDTPGETFEWWNERMHPEDRETVVSSIISALEGQDQRWEQEYRFLRPDGQYGHVLDRGFVIRDESGKAVRMIGALCDVTERVAAQERINTLQAELVHISRISAMETMGSALAHEVSQPLTAAGNYLLGARRMIEAGELGSNEIRHGLEQAQTEITRAGEIIRSLRQMVEHGVANTQPVSVFDAVREALRMAIPAHLLGSLTRSIDVPPAIQVMADPIQLQQVLFNLIRNSAEAVAHSERKHIGIGARGQNGEVTVRITDTGNGIPATIAPRLFSAFASTKPDGLGVGLSICRTIIEAHSGKIWAENVEGGKGAAFAFTLPAAEA